ncbi:MAG: glucose 1-dehydrogenase [Dehalococcoidia bacterium]
MALDEYKLDGKVAIVTGASRGIGRTICLALAEAGADIVAVARTVPDIERTAEDVRGLGRRAIAVPTDVTRSDQIKAMVARAIGEFGRVDILVNNAGMAITKPLVATPGADGISEEEWHRVLDTNLTSAVLCCMEVGPHMMRQGVGKVINVASVEGVRGTPYRISYAVSKAGLIHLTKSLALEWARYKINVNAMAPGYYRTALTDDMLAQDHIYEGLMRQIPFRSLGDQRGLGLLAVYLASDASEYMTGQTVSLDGGFSA